MSRDVAEYVVQNCVTLLFLNVCGNGFLWMPHERDATHFFKMKHAVDECKRLRVHSYQVITDKRARVIGS